MGDLINVRPPSIDPGAVEVDWNGVGSAAYDVLVGDDWDAIVAEGQRVGSFYQGYWSQLPDPVAGAKRWTQETSVADAARGAADVAITVVNPVAMGEGAGRMLRAAWGALGSYGSDPEGAGRRLGEVLTNPGRFFGS